uniref:Uncharacterized protein n=1 Tax=Setaria viridis TaxID=4556 RepID=A0A4U6STA1_SETVI|nr:hypothetical protein SEVIR_9G081925v2 [Setaria viridis]
MDVDRLSTRGRKFGAARMQSASGAHPSARPPRVSRFKSNGSNRASGPAARLRRGSAPGYDKARVNGSSDTDGLLNTILPLCLSYSSQTLNSSTPLLPNCPSANIWYQFPRSLGLLCVRSIIPSVEPANGFGLDIEFVTRTQKPVIPVHAGLICGDLGRSGVVVKPRALYSSSTQSRSNGSKHKVDFWMRWRRSLRRWI